MGNTNTNQDATNQLRQLLTNLSRESPGAWEQTLGSLDEEDRAALQRAMPALRMLEDTFAERRARRRSRPAE